MSAVLLGLGAAASADCDDCFIPPVVLAAFASVPFTVTTTLGGAIIGAASPGERWVRVRVPVVLRPPRV